MQSTIYLVEVTRAGAERWRETPASYGEQKDAEEAMGRRDRAQKGLGLQFRVVRVTHEELARTQPELPAVPAMTEV